MYEQVQEERDQVINCTLEEVKAQKALIEELAFASLNERLSFQFHHGREMFSLQLKDFIKQMEQNKK